MDSPVKEEPKYADFRYFEYKLPNGRSVFLSNRPDWCDPKDIRDFLHDKYPQIRFMFTDDYAELPQKAVEHLHDVPETHWYCWVPGIEPAIETIWTALFLMHRFDTGQSVEVPMWMHCDFSSMRAPTFFGLYLNAAYPDKVKEICDPLREAEKEFGNRMFGWPDQYAEVEMKRHPTSKTLVERWREGGPDKAHYFMEWELKDMIREKT